MKLDVNLNIKTPKLQIPNRWLHSGEAFTAGSIVALALWSQDASQSQIGSIALTGLWSQRRTELLFKEESYIIQGVAFNIYKKFRNRHKENRLIE